MKRKDLEELKKIKTPQQIINMHTDWKINLTDKQIDELLKERDKNWKR